MSIDCPLDVGDSTTGIVKEPEPEADGSGGMTVILEDVDDDSPGSIEPPMEPGRFDPVRARAPSLKKQSPPESEFTEKGIHVQAPQPAKASQAVMQFV